MKSVLIMIAIVVLACGSSYAQTQPAAPATEEPNPFAQGTACFSLSGAYLTPIMNARAQVYNFNASIGTYFIDNNSINLELSGYYADQTRGEPDAVIGGVGVLGRWHFLRFDKWSIFFDGGGSITYADNTFPTEPFAGTHYNLTGKAGFGATYELRDHLFLTAGARYFHLSNAQVHGKDQNPNYNGVQMWGGLMWTW
jgi:hypothetical protein